MSRRTTFVSLGAAMLALVAATEALRARAHAGFDAAQSYEAVYYLPPDETIRFFSLGYDEASADLIWMRALIYFGEEFLHDGSVEHVFEYADAMLTLDPRFRAVYGWVGMAGLYRPTAVDASDAERAAEIMERGVELFPDDGDLAWDLGAVLAFELPPLLEDEAARDDARARGMPHLLRASRHGAAPPWMTLANASILDHLGRTELAARHLEEMYLSVDDPDLRRQIAERIASLREQAAADAFVAAMRDLEERRRNSFPYIESTLFLFVGERPPVDVDTPIREGFPQALAAPTP